MKNDQEKKKLLIVSEQKIVPQTKFFHWVIALCVLGLLLVGFSFSWLPDTSIKFSLYTVHKSVGILVFILMIGRLFYRLKYSFPPLPKAGFPFENILARSVEGLLYLLLFIQPLVGWAMNSAAGYPVSFFGLFMLPSLWEKSPMYAAFFKEAHEKIGLLLVGLIGIHIMGALYHHFIRKNSVLRRMLPKVSFLS